MSQRSGPPKKKDEGFSNNPFKSAIKSLKDQEKKEAQDKAAAEAAKRKTATARAAMPKSKKPPREEDEAALFYSAMDGVEQITHRGEAPKPNPRLPELIDENAEALAQLSELVAGQGDFHIEDTGESMEGAGPGVDRNLLRALRRGDFSVQDRLDLHGLKQAQAEEAVVRFLSDSRRAKKRCVLIVHGRGLNSQDQLPVLKERLKGWLSQKRIGNMVLAFATARPQDGGPGAVYVLLRR